MSAFDVWCNKWGCTGQARTELELYMRADIDMAYTSDRISEAAVQQDVRLEAPRIGGAMWRNNNGAFEDSEGRWVRYGLGNDSKQLNGVWKSSDLIGITPRRATHVGELFGVFTAGEIKNPGWKLTKGDKRGQAQAKFMNTVRTLGGLAGFIQSIDDYRKVVKE